MWFVTGRLAGRSRAGRVRGHGPLRRKMAVGVLVLVDAGALLLGSSLGSGPARAADASTVISFDDLGVPAGGRVTVNSQYSAQGVTFNNVSAISYSQPPNPAAFAHSGSVAIEQCYAVEFCSTPIRASFTAGQQRVKVWVGFSFSLSQPLIVRLTAFGAGNASVGTAQVTLPANTAVTPVSRALEVSAANPVIRSIEVSVPGGYMNAVVVDDLEFSTPGPAPTCTATSTPSVQLIQPAGNVLVEKDEFLLEGSVATGGAPIESASIFNAAKAGGRQGTLFPTLIQPVGGKFGPTRFSGLLLPGENRISVTAQNCLGTGSSQVVSVFWNTIPSVCPPAAEERRVSSAAQLIEVLRSIPEQDPHPTVRVIVPKNVSWSIADRDIPLQSGVQLVGERGDLGSRPLLYTNDKSRKYSLFKIWGNDVCVEGLHFQGPKPTKDHAKGDGICPGVKTCYIDAIRVVPDAGLKLGRNVLIVDNEFQWWSNAGVYVLGALGSVATTKDYDAYCTPPPCAHPEKEDAALIRIVGNYMHDNAMDGGGYGVHVGAGAYAWIEGNVFDTNRHAVAASGRPYSGYIARFNYILAGGVMQESYWNQHFDVHGTANDGYGGYGGEYFEIAYNTIRGEQTYSFLGVKTRSALMIRGRPAQGAWFHDNVVVHNDLDSAVSLKMSKYSTGIGEDHEEFNFHASGNRFNTDYSLEIAAGDFDGDGRTDAFVATGTAWFFSRAAKGPWTYLRPSDKRTRDLAFADIDNDGTTDVLWRDPAGRLGSMSGGRGDFTTFTTSPVAMKDLRFGDFDGDGLTDIFYTQNRQWWIWYGDTRAWTPVQSSAFAVSALLFGDFDEVTGTDVVAVTGGKWQTSSGGTKTWKPLNSKLVSSFANAVVADFDGNGKPDIAFGDGQKWRYSPDGRGPLKVLRNGSSQRPHPALRLLPIGHFDGGSRAKVISFEYRLVASGNQVRLVVGDRLFGWALGANEFGQRSGQNMR